MGDTQRMAAAKISAANMGLKLGHAKQERAAGGTQVAPAPREDGAPSASLDRPKGPGRACAPRSAAFAA